MTRSAFIRTLFIACVAAYPFIILFGLKYLPPSFFGIVLLVVIALRFGVILPAERPVVIPMLLIYIAYAVTATLAGSETMLLYYPAVVNLTLCAVFLRSLWQDAPMLYTIVEARSGKLEDFVRPYLYWLTVIWAAFFAINALISVWTTTLTLEVWTLYNGFLSYCLIALLFGVEYLYRGHYRRKRTESR